MQLSCIKHLKSYFVNHPELRTDLEGNDRCCESPGLMVDWSDVMGQLSLSADVNVRTQLMAQIRAITNGNLLDISDKIKQILCERARDKIVSGHGEIPSDTSVSSGKCAKKPWTIWVMSTKKNALGPTGPMRCRSDWPGWRTVSFICTIRKPHKTGEKKSFSLSP